MQPPPDWQTPLQVDYRPQREADHDVRENNRKETQKDINE